MFLGFERFKRCVCVYCTYNNKNYGEMYVVLVFKFRALCNYDWAARSRLRRMFTDQNWWPPAKEQQKQCK